MRQHNTNKINQHKNVSIHPRHQGREAGDNVVPRRAHPPGQAVDEREGVPVQALPAHGQS